MQTKQLQNRLFGFWLSLEATLFRTWIVLISTLPKGRQLPSQERGVSWEGMVAVCKTIKILTTTVSGKSVVKQTDVESFQNTVVLQISISTTHILGLAGRLR